jgi:patatin-like phospholipase/acyl hydrolase
MVSRTQSFWDNLIRRFSSSESSTNDSGSDRSNSHPRIIVCFDGGGIRGLATVTVLRCIEQRYHLRLSEKCDKFVGTSTGSFIAAMVGGLGWSAEQMQDMYMSECREMMPRKYVDIVGGLFRPKFGEDKRRFLRKLLRNKDGEYRLRDCRKHVMIAAYCIDPRFPGRHIFDSIDHPEVKLWQALDASSAAPVYFPSASVDMSPMERFPDNPDASGQVSSESEPLDFVDGAMTLNNPSLIGLIHCRPGDVLLSIGTGGMPVYVRPDTVATGVLDLLNFISETHTHETLAAELCDRLGVKYVRINGTLRDGAVQDMTDVSEKNLIALIQTGQAWFQDHVAELDLIFNP